MNRRAALFHLGAPRLALGSLALLAVAVLCGQWRAGAMAWMLALAFGVLALQLSAAIVVHPAFRRQVSLLVFHLALLALVVLVALGRLSALEGRLELTQGVPFDGTLIEANAGALHPGGLDRLAFVHDGFEIAYAPGRQRGKTSNRVRWVDADGTPRSAVVGDHHPLVLRGYRFYTTPNKGFAPLVTWRPADGGPAVTGAVHLPSYPMHELRQAQQWSLPDGRAVWLMLQIDETLIDPDAASQFRLPGRHALVLRVGEQRFELQPGQRVALSGGTLSYDGLRTWMGYKVFYDWTLPWLLAASLLAALSLAWHYVGKFWARPAPHARALATASAMTPLRSSGDA